VLLCIGLLYYAAPNAKVRGFRSVLPGAVAAVVVWAIASAVFALYVANFGSYDKTYGSLGAIIAFLVWVYLSNCALMLGVEINAEVQRGRQLQAGNEDPDPPLPPREKPDNDEKSDAV